LAARRTSQMIDPGAQHTVQAALGRWVARILTVTGFWVGWVAAPLLSIPLHFIWRSWWTFLGLLLIGVALAALDMHLTHNRGTLVGRTIAAATSFAGACWLAWVTMAGYGRADMGVWFIGGGALAFAWSKWVHIRASEDADEGLGALFGADTQRAGVDPMRVIRITDATMHKIRGVVRLLPGKVHADAVRAAPVIESAKGLPPGSLQFTADEDHAGQAKFVLSDPRSLRKPIPWPGPSMPGASIAAPIRPSVYQDGEPLAYDITNHHLKIMGMSGAGKTYGWCYNEVGETITRRDAAVLMIDISKGEQTVGALRPALHRCEVTPAGVHDLFAGVHRARLARMRHLGGLGLQRWEEGCGLSHLTCWCEEAPDITAELTPEELETWISDLRTGRSAGMRWVFSLQRSDWTQMPTLARGQMGDCCFGVNQDDDAKFGLSPYQYDQGCEPQLLGDSEPGSHFLDTGRIAKERKVMKLRTYDWGRDTTLMAAHAARYTAASRPLDAITAAALAPPHRANPDPPAARPPSPGGGQPPLLPTQVVAQLQPPPGQPPPTPAPPVRLVPPPEEEGDTAMGNHPPKLDGNTDGLEVVIDATGMDALQFTPPPGQGDMTPEAAAQAFRNQLATWAAGGKLTFAIGDLAPVLDATGRSRSWLYDVISRLEAEQAVQPRETYPRTWAIGA
jgi:hypothetical protein